MTIIVNSSSQKANIDFWANFHYVPGIFKDFSVLKEKWVKTARVIEPDDKAHRKYKEYLTIYKNLYKHTKEDMHRLAELSAK